MFSIRRPLVVALLGVVAGCGASTKLTDVWLDEAYDFAAIRSILVVGVTDDDARRRLFEREVGKQFEDSGVVATACSAVFATGSDPGVEEIKGACEAREIDAVLVTTLVSIDRMVENVPERTTTEVTPNRQYTTFSNYYKEATQTVDEPGYTLEHTTVRLESKIYDVETETLIWSARSETFDPKGAEEVVDDVGRAILKSLSEHGLVAR